MESYFNRVYKVPEYFTVIKPGDYVEWDKYLKRKTDRPMTYTGRVVQLKTTTFGASAKKQGAKIETSEAYQKVYPGRRYTTIAVDKLRKI